MAEEIEVPDPEGRLFCRPEKASPGVSPLEPPLEEAWEDLREAPGDSPPAQAPGSRTGSDVDRMSKDVLVEYLHCKLKSVSLYPDSEAREFLKNKLLEAEAFFRRLQEKERLQAQESRLKAENQHLQQELQETKRSQWTGNLLFTFPWYKTGGDERRPPGAPLQEDREVLPEAPRNPPSAQASGGRTGSDLDGMSKDVMVEFLHCKLKSVSLFPDPVAREFLKDNLWEAEVFFRRLQEKERLQAQASRLKAASQRLQQELQETKRSQTGHLLFTLPWSKTDFHIQVRVAGKTGGCENEFLKKVSARLAYHMYLKVERYREGSRHFLLVFCPVATSAGSDMANALEGLGSEPKAVLVMLHHKLKESTSPVDTRKQAHHPAVVRTLHARYTLESGFYACPMNEEAVAAVAEVLQDHR